MSLRTSAARYAKALFEVALAESDPSRIEADLAAVAAAMDEHADLERALVSPAIPQAVRVSITRALSDRVGAQPPTAKLLELLATRGRLELVPHVRDVYRERLLAHQQVVRASVTSAAPLPPAKVLALEQRLSALTGKQVQLEVGVDPSLIGGVVATIGSTVYDGSIRTQLQKMKQQLVEQA